jgi:hypothetical protein
LVKLVFDVAACESANLLAFDALKEQSSIVIREPMANCGDYWEANRLRIKPLCCRGTTDPSAGSTTSVFGNATCRRGWTTPPELPPKGAPENRKLHG